MESGEAVRKALLVEEPVGKALIRMTIQMVFGMVGIVVFHLVDTFFVAQLRRHEFLHVLFHLRTAKHIFTASGRLSINSQDDYRRIKQS